MLGGRLQLAGAAALFCYLRSGAAQAGDDPKPTTDRIIIAKDHALWSLAGPGEEPTRLLSLPWPEEELQSLQVASDGSALIVRARGFTAWAPLQMDSESTLRFLPCGAHAQVSSDGNRVLCATQDEARIALYTVRPTFGVEIVDRKALGPLFFAAGDGIISPDAQGQLIEVQQKQSRVVSSHQPSRFLMVTPDGKRALGTYDEGPIKIVYTFRLDGKAIKRTLVHAARNLSISADSAWAAIQQEVDACAVRIAGGQYMCWRRYEAVDISSGGRSLLVSRSNERHGHDLFLGSVSGTSARKPTPMIEGVARIGAFWPTKTPGTATEVEAETGAMTEEEKE